VLYALSINATLLDLTNAQQYNK